MYKPFLKLMFALFILFDLASLTQAQVESSCFAKAAKKIKPGKEITLIKQDGSEIVGRLRSIDSVSSTLTILYNLDSTTYSYHISDIEKIKYRGTGGFKLGYAILGFFIGAGIGAGIGVLAGGDDPINQGVGGTLGGLGGGLVGFFGIGAAMSSAIPSTRAIECK